MCNDPAITEAMVRCGYDFIWIDAEHVLFDKQQLLMHIMAANGAGATAFVRVTREMMGKSCIATFLMCL